MHSDQTTPAPIITTACGCISGVVDRGVPSYLAIPYAQAPVGELRFRPPRARRPWTDTHDGSTLGPACVQPVNPEGPELGAELQSEDSLLLNIWTPCVGGERLPVMVWIHGGALVEGSARNPWYNGARLARAGGVVVVAVQYRLGVFGFLNLAEIGGSDFADSGNLGLLDQVAALQWVRDHIQAFGGDPDNVTIFGESAGGASVLMLMHMPSARGLFHKAIAQSPSPQLGRTQQRSAAIAQQLMHCAKVSTVPELQALSVQQLLDAELELMATGLGADAFWPTAGIASLPLHAVTAAHRNEIATVPLVIGTTLDELCYWTELEGLPLFSRPQERWQEQLYAVVGSRRTAVEAAYAAPTGTDESEALRQHRLQLLGDLNFRMPSIRIAESLSAAGSSVWMYLFSYRSTSTTKRLDSAHAMELPFLFDTLDAPLANSFTGTGPGREQLVEVMQTSWTSFARDGSPRVPGLALWPIYDTARRTTLQIDIACSLLDDPMSEQRRVWLETPFDGQDPDESSISRLSFSDE